MQTATEWLWEQIDGIIPYQDINTSQLFIGLLEQAKEMEKQQIIDAHNDGYESISGQAEQYYNETYGSKGSDETKILNDMKHKLNDFNPFSNAAIHESQEYNQIDQDNPITKGSTALVNVASSQTEISDEEIKEAAKDYHRNNGVYYGQEKTFIDAIKWYREQLKSRQ